MKIDRQTWTLAAGAVVAVGIAIVLAILPSLKNFYGHRDGVLIREDVTYRPGSTNDKHRLDLYLPTHTREPFPLVVFVHGGIWKAQDRRLFQQATGLYGAVGLSLAHKGVGVAVLSYRQYPQAKFSEGLDDIATAVGFAQRSAASWGADPEAVVVVGHSNGGLLVSLLALEPRYLRSAGVELGRIRGFVSIAGAYSAEGLVPTLKPDEAPILIECAGGRDGLPTYSPVRLARADVPPLLLVAALHDYPVLVTQYREMVRAMAPAGDKLTAVELPGDDHMSMILHLGTPKDTLTAPLLQFIQRVTARGTP